MDYFAIEHLGSRVLGDNTRSSVQYILLKIALGDCDTAIATTPKQSEWEIVLLFAYV